MLREQQRNAQVLVEGYEIVEEEEGYSRKGIFRYWEMNSKIVGEELGEKRKVWLESGRQMLIQLEREGHIVSE